MKHYSLAEAVLAHLTPLRWCEDTGALVVDRRAIAESGGHYETICLMIGLVFAISAYLLGTLLFAGSVTAKLGTVLLGLLAATFLLAAVCIRVRRLRSS